MVHNSFNFVPHCSIIWYRVVHNDKTLSILHIDDLRHNTPRHMHPVPRRFCTGTRRLRNHRVRERMPRRIYRHRNISGMPEQRPMRCHMPNGICPANKYRIGNRGTPGKGYHAVTANQRHPNILLDIIGTGQIQKYNSHKTPGPNISHNRIITVLLYHTIFSWLFRGVAA